MSKSAQTIPKGYRQTEVGVIPVDWEVMPLGALADVSAGGTPSRSVSEYWDGDIPWVTTTEVNFGRITSTEQNISELGLKNSAAKLLRPGTILLALYGQGKTRGKVAILDIEATSNQACAAIVLTTKVSQRFILNYLAGRYEFIRSLSNTGNQENLNGIIVKSIPIPLPPTLAEQEAIADALSDADGLIESLEKLIAKKRQIKHGTMQELLTGQRRLPGFSGKWIEKALGSEIVGLDAGVSVNSDRDTTDFDADVAAILKTSCVESGRFLPWESKRIPATELRRATLTPAADTLLISRMNTFDLVGESGYVEKDHPNLYVPDRLWMTRFRKDTYISARWLSYVLTTQSFREKLKGIATGTSGSMKNISKAAFLALTVAQPPLPEQTAIATILSDMDAEIAALETKLAKARQVKQGMMQELLTGRIRLV